jgi:hypothetical protein
VSTTATANDVRRSVTALVPSLLTRRERTSATAGLRSSKNANYNLNGAVVYAS